MLTAMCGATMFNCFMKGFTIMADYIPGSDTAFQAWVKNFVTYANAHLTELGMIAGDMIPVLSGQANFDAKMRST